MREITNHRVLPGIDEINNKIKVVTYDDADSNGAHHKYQTFYLTNGQWENGQQVQFHKVLPKTGPEIKNVPTQPVIPTGLTHEALLAIVIDRLRNYQKSEFSCRENALAITHLEEAMNWLKLRTADRMERGVKGTLNK